MTALILAASPQWDSKTVKRLAEEADLILCADGGYLMAKELGLRPDLLIGDFDSCTPEREDLPKMVFPTHKDDTDTGLAIRQAVEMGAKTIHITGCFGGRLDHTVANLQSVIFGLDLGARVELWDDRNHVFALQNERRVLQRQEKCYVSFFAISDRCEGVSLEGFVYPLQNAVLTNRFPLGVSNQFEAAEAVVTVKKGTLLGIISKG